MGSWSACCGISKLPIDDGDDVVDFFIAEIGPIRDRGHICYSNDLWTPVTIQTYGKYDDYGRIEPEDGWHKDYVETVLRSHVVELEEGDNEYHDIPVKRDDMDFRLAEEAMHEGRLFFKVPGSMRANLNESRKDSKGGLPPVSDNVRITRMMIHRFVFEEIISWGFDTWTHVVTLEKMIEAGMEAVADFRKELAEETDEILREIARLRFDLDIGRNKNVFLASFHDGENGDLYVPHKSKDYLSLAMNSDPENTLAIVTELSKFIIFRINMGLMQFLWTPQTGSQNSAYPELLKLYRVCGDYAQKQLDIEGDDEE